MKKNKFILIVEEKDVVYNELSRHENSKGLKFVTAKNEEDADYIINLFEPDLVLVDMETPKSNGLHLLLNARKKNKTPLVITSKGDEWESIQKAFKLGADDYIRKPFRAAEVLARINSILRRKNNCSCNSLSNKIITKRLTIYTDSVCVEVRTKKNICTPNLTITEFKILACLAEEPCKVITREKLIDKCLPKNNCIHDTLNSHISKLRKKLSRCGLEGVPESVRKVGYKLGDSG
ncbi:response regulator transcription factor [Klebsiella pneumoniae]